MYVLALTMPLQFSNIDIRVAEESRTVKSLAERERNEHVSQFAAVRDEFASQLDAERDNFASQLAAKTRHRFAV
jgi:hypothetical protein